MKKTNKINLLKLIRKSCATTLVLVLLPHPWVTETKAQSAIGIANQAIGVLSSTISQGMMQAQANRPVDLSPSLVRNVPAVNLPAPLNVLFLQRKFQCQDTVINLAQVKNILLLWD